MSGKTLFDVTMALDPSKVVWTSVDSATIQKQKNAIKGTKTLGVTEASLERPPMTFVWQETPDKASGMVTLAISKVSLAIKVTAKVMVDKAIPTSTPCHKHVVDHEQRHVDAYKRSAITQAAELKRIVAGATAPQLKAPVKVAKKDVGTFKEKQEKRIEEALDKAIAPAMEAMKAESLKIHTSAEAAKTNSVCAAHLGGAGLAPNAGAASPPAKGGKP